MTFPKFVHADGTRCKIGTMPKRTTDRRVIESLASQDRSGEVDDSYGRTGDAEDTIRRWYNAARQAGDDDLVRTIDRIGVREAGRLYETARREMDRGGSSHETVHHSTKRDLSDWLDRHGYQHSHARVQKTPHPYAVSPRMAHASILQEQPHPYAVSPRLAHARILKVSRKDPAVMTAGEINKELDKLGEQRDRLGQQMIDAGRGHERPSEWLRLNDPLSIELRNNSDRRDKLRNEIARRYGPGAPTRLPKGFGPIRGHARVIHQEPTGRLVYAAHERDHHITTSGRRALERSQFALPPGPAPTPTAPSGRPPPKRASTRGCRRPSR